MSNNTNNNGHIFMNNQRPTWCDVCDELIWGVTKNSAVRCKACKFTCHHRCLNANIIECSVSKVIKNENISNSTVQFERNIKPMVSSEINSIKDFNVESAVLEYNKESTGLVFTMCDDGTNFSGFVRVQINFTRPVKVASEIDDLSLRSAMSKNYISNALSNYDNNSLTKKDYFYVPSGSFTAIHIRSDTTAAELIALLLQKFNLASNIHKYSIFDQLVINDQKTVLTKINNNDFPLVITLKWGANNLTHSFTIMENDYNEIVWEHFAVPELKNFLIILNREEEERVKQISEKYGNMIKTLSSFIENKT